MSQYENVNVNILSQENHKQIYTAVFIFTICVFIYEYLTSVSLHYKKIFFYIIAFYIMILITLYVSNFIVYF